MKESQTSRCRWEDGGDCLLRFFCIIQVSLFFSTFYWTLPTSVCVVGHLTFAGSETLAMVGSGRVLLSIYTSVVESFDVFNDV